MTKDIPILLITWEQQDQLVYTMSIVMISIKYRQEDKPEPSNYKAYITGEHIYSKEDYLLKTYYRKKT